MDRAKILIVDDDPDLRRALNLRLRANQYDTVFAHDGLSAVSMAHEEHPDRIVLDLGLPAGDGLRVLERLRGDASLSSIPAIVLTARDPQSHERSALEAGVTAYFLKPPDNIELLEVIRATLGNRQGRAGAASLS